MTTILRGHVVTPVGDGHGDHELAAEPHGAVALDSGVIADVGLAATVLARHPGAEVHDYGDRLLVPGFVDCHVHYPQLDMIASPGLALLKWLERYTFPAEAMFSDRGHCAAAASFFADQLLAHGVTTACVYSTVHPGSAEALFRVAHALGLRVITGKTCMDRNAPEELLDTPESAYEDSLALLETWHGVGRLEYAITPRFAPTSSERQLEMLGRLAQEHPEGSSRPTCRRRRPSARGWRSCSPAARTTRPSMSGTDWSGPGPSSATASTCPVTSSIGWAAPARPSRTARRPTCSSAPACSGYGSRWPPILACASGWAPTSSSSTPPRRPCWPGGPRWPTTSRSCSSPS